MPTLIARTEGSRRNLGASRAFLAVSAGRLAGIYDFFVSLEMGDARNHSDLGAGSSLSRWAGILNQHRHAGNLPEVLQRKNTQGCICRTRGGFSCLSLSWRLPIFFFKSSSQENNRVFMGKTDALGEYRGASLIK